MITVEEARRIIHMSVAPLPPTTADLAEACERVLRESITADGFYPSADRSMMDGYALDAEDKSERFRVIAEITPGSAPAVILAPGECARIFTGAILPSGATQVIMQEETERDGEWMIPNRRSEQRFVRRKGAEASPGDVLLDEGAILRPAELAVLAQVGIVRPKVSPHPTITHIATGEELIDPAGIPATGQIRDTNSILVRALAAQTGAVVSAQTRLRDDIASIVSFAKENPSDLLLISGGASVGEHDFGARALQELGFSIQFDRVNLRPGKPLTFASRKSDQGIAFVIPGNPVSHFVCFHVAVRLAIERLQKAPMHWHFLQARVSSTEALRADPRDTFWPAHARVETDGTWLVEPRRWSSSGDTFSLAGTNALIHIAAGVTPNSTLPTLVLNGI